jgi:2-polyprenyl-3-methyl-5-hydroxy-6-metoxy-1,4-benzoquinol methylase
MNSDPSAVSPEAQHGWKVFYEGAELLDVACPLCTARLAIDIANEFGIAISRCDSCGVVYTRTPLRDSRAHYTVSRAEFLSKYEAVFHGTANHPRDTNYDEILEVLEELSPAGDLLDVGTHCGFFLRRAKARGWRTTGIEPSPTSSALAREWFELDVKTGFLQDAGLPAYSFDAITMLDVLEHVRDPRSLLREVARVLRPGGHVLIKVPNLSYVLGKHRMLRWIPGVVQDVFDARERLVYYSRSTLVRLLLEEGFDLELVTVPSPIQNGGWLRRRLRALGSLAARRLPRGVATPLAPDILAVGRKPFREA